MSDPTVKLYVGIDAHQETLSIAVLGAAAERPEPGRVLPNEPGRVPCALQEAAGARPDPGTTSDHRAGVDQLGRSTGGPDNPVCDNCLVSLEGRRYSVPFHLVGQSVELHASAALVAVHAPHTKELLVIDPAHYEGNPNRPAPPRLDPDRRRRGLVRRAPPRPRAHARDLRPDRHRSAHRGGLRISGPAACLPRPSR